jgi:ribosomal protein L7/L12
MLPDTRLRAALDLAIQASPYNRAINPQRYNMLLSRLAERFEEKTDTREARSTCTLPSGRVSAGNPQETDAMTTKLSAEQSKTASGILTKLDETAKEIQASYEKLGLPLKDAKKMVNALDRIADDFEINAFGEESWENRRQEIEDKTAAVYQRDPDESYMDTFQNPHQPHQVDADEPYMDAFSDDDSWSEGE